ncbi:MAG: 5'-methylthioadenosine/S-adenosylhomocysteine nucleosidase [Brevundimonas sp.]|uniref:5'-methylthioadenosine/S-adenosylhomocysteine nucleosidase n=1 Tax=Brevundimonas sp. TaxID=1871086 RepID=UPI00272447A4|nr:5'-methylthioadenosine/S-adenosylhomocysteine nucleosidase [Brevundimonas sp.]MDO9587309.1 5'-methylthioadenosine/S-adenosylhomocysteine nucleosidase [Brevundimonas sp.]MDP3368301.1 5'-methylthioadenosine/S-adenosylhomocysteine nucleosidase [Brevundimonas sp.]MDP3657791.1 5'-methylthioadenosine/S-adenosylhomocysteine nucleosidase [Brevundimonas sp.]
MSRDWTLSRFGPKTALCVMAAAPEYGPALRARIRPLITGVGPVEAAVGVAHALESLRAGDGLPDVVVSLGSAGSRTLDHARVYRVTEVSYRDMDASALGFPKGETPYPRLPAVLPLADGPAALPGARLATGASVVSGVAYDGVDADMVDMETFAVVRAAARFGVPAMGLRGVSDGRTDLSALEHWTDALGEIDQRLAEALDLLHDHFTPVLTEPA